MLVPLKSFSATFSFLKNKANILKDLNKIKFNIFNEDKCMYKLETHVTFDALHIWVLCMQNVQVNSFYLSENKNKSIFTSDRGARILGLFNKAPV